MKIVVTADVHIHPFRICSKDGGHDRLNDGLSILKQSLDLAAQENAIWVMAGDFKEPKTYWPQEALTGAHEILRKYPGLPKLMVAGNHDAKGIGGTGLAPFRDCATVVEEASIVELHKTIFICAPWDANRALVASMAGKSGAPLIAHAFLRDVMIGPEYMRLPEKGVPLIEYGPFSVAFFGDIHKGQCRIRRPNRSPLWEPYGGSRVARSIVRDAAPWNGDVFYPGDPYQQNWGERNDAKGVLIADLKTGEVQFQVLKAPRFRHFECNEQELEQAFAAKVFHQWEGDFVRVIYTGKPSMVLGALQNLEKTFRSLQVIPRRPVKEEKRADIHAGMSKKELLEGYMAARPPDDNLGDPKRVLEAGLRLTREE